MPRKGYKQTEEHKRKMSLVKKGCYGWNKGKHHSTETLEKLKLAKVGYIPSQKGLKEYYLFNNVWNKGLKVKIGKCKTKTGKHKRISHISWCSQPENLCHVPNGFVIHHLDFNSENNYPDNLLLLDRSSHIKLHSKINSLGLTNDKRN